MNPFAAEVLAFLTNAPGFRVTPRLKALIQHDEMNVVWPLLQELARRPGIQSWEIAKRFLSFASDLTNAWRQLDKKASRRVVKRRLTEIRGSSRDLEQMLGKHELDLLLWNDQLRTVLSIHTNIGQLLSQHQASPTEAQKVEVMKRLLSGDRSVDLKAAVGLIRELLRALNMFTEITQRPLLLAIHPTKVGARNAEQTFYNRSLSWFLLASTGAPHDRIVCAVVSALLDKPIDLDTVRKDRKRLQAALRGRGFPSGPSASSSLLTRHVVQVAPHKTN